MLQLVEHFIVFKLTMEKLDIDYSLKNIPIPSNESYLIKLIEKIESVVKRMRWRAHFFLQEKHESDIRREDFGFKSKITLPQCEHMEAFEKELLGIIPNIEFRSVKDALQKKLKGDIPKIKQSPTVFVFANKTSNIYELPEQQHEKLLHDKVTKTYKKAPPKLETSINLEAKNTAGLFNLDDRIECIARTPAFITLKDYKPDF